MHTRTKKIANAEIMNYLKSRKELTRVPAEYLWFFTSKSPVHEIWQQRFVDKLSNDTGHKQSNKKWQES
jgi:hypothetical protein